MLNPHDYIFISGQAEIGIEQVKSTIDLFDQGMTIPFISRYRKDKTGNLDEVKIGKIQQWLDYMVDLNNRKETVLKTISGQEKLTPELEKKIIETYSKTELEDIYLPYKPKRRTRATVAKEKGLEPLAKAILDAQLLTDIDELARPFISVEKKVNSCQDALDGAGDIIAEQFSENADFRKKIRSEMFATGELTVHPTKDWVDKRSKYENYYRHREPVKSIPSHRILAILRGKSEGVLKSEVSLDPERLVTRFSIILYPAGHPRASYLNNVLKDSLKRLILPSIETEIMADLKLKADEESILIFAQNLEHLLLSPPAGGCRLLGVDPGLRTGCKLAILDETGNLLAHTSIFPHPPQKSVAKAQKIVKEFMQKYNLEAVVIGNGAASRETFSFFKEFLDPAIILFMVNESGASIYSASAAGREEFPDQDVTVRGTVSIGRRFQDPLAELVKIDPKSIGVGQYQHDVNQTLLKQKLDSVVSSVVNRVGVDINTASKHLLKYVSGIGESLALSIVSYRQTHGRFQNRQQLLKIPKFGPKAFQQSAGFLRISQGENPLDSTGIHPESYCIVDKICHDQKITLDQIIRNKSVIDKIPLNNYVTIDFGLFTLTDIIHELEAPGRDPRANFEICLFAEDIHTINDIKEGMTLNGIVTNVTRFGAFVDIGVHQDGLIHISELSHRFVSQPEEIVSVGQKVRVMVLHVDLELKRIQLSLKALQQRDSAQKQSSP